MFKYQFVGVANMSELPKCPKQPNQQNSYQNYKFVRIANISIYPSSYFWCLGRPQTSGLQRAFLRKALQVV